MKVLAVACVACEPQFLEGGVVELEAPVRAEQRHRLGKVVERFALRVEQLVVAALELVFLGKVLVEIGDAAERMLLADHMQRAPVGEIPIGLARFDCRVGR